MHCIGLQLALATECMQASGRPIYSSATAIKVQIDVVTDLKATISRAGNPGNLIVSVGLVYFLNKDTDAHRYQHFAVSISIT